MNRRQLLSLPALPLVRTALAQPRDTRPNFVFIMADDMGVHDLGCYGQKFIRTPHMDRAAAEGLRFTDCYAGASVCAPSRSVLMTGQHTGHTRVRANASRLTGDRVPLRPEDRTIASLLKGPEWQGAFDEDRAYATGLFGKWGLGEPGTTGLPNNHGFDEWYGFLNQQHAHHHYPQYLWRNKTREPLRGNWNNGRREYASDLFLREALHFIDRHRYQPFFLYFSPTIPHAEFDAPDLGAYASQPWPEPAKHYAAMVTRFDSYVGRIIDRLREAGLDENTLVFVTSDNGAPCNHKEFTSMGTLRGRKGDVHEGGLRVPMLARWPGRIKPGVSALPWSFQDVLPTLADLAQSRGVPPNVDGISIAPALLGKPQNPDRPLYWEQFAGNRFQQAVRWGPWKAIRPQAKAPLELYHLPSDPGEAANVAAQNPAQVRKIEEYLAVCRTDSPEYPLERPHRG